MDTMILLFMTTILSFTIIIVVLLRYTFRFIFDALSIAGAKNMQDIIDARKEFVFPQVIEEDDESDEYKDVSEITIEDISV